LLTLLIFEAGKKFDAAGLRIDKRMKYHTIAVTVYSYIVVYTGALVRHTEASLVCRDWPFCLNETPMSLPSNMYEWIQMGHRGMAGLFFIWIAYIALMAAKHYKDQKIIYFGWIAAFILVSLQVAAGAVVVFTSLNIYVALAHALFITCLFGLLSYFIMLFTRPGVVITSVRDPEKAGASELNSKVLTEQ
jgi:cytochrome c oxidase assembly protein subunit 15